MVWGGKEKCLRDAGDERAVGGVGGPGREDLPARDEHRLYPQLVHGDDSRGRFATYCAEAAARKNGKLVAGWHERGSATHRFSKRTVWVSPTTEPTKAARARTVAAKEYCIVKVKVKRGSVKEIRSVEDEEKTPSRRFE